MAEKNDKKNEKNDKTESGTIVDGFDLSTDEGRAGYAEKLRAEIDRGTEKYHADAGTVAEEANGFWLNVANNTVHGFCLGLHPGAGKSEKMNDMVMVRLLSPCLVNRVVRGENGEPIMEKRKSDGRVVKKSVTEVAKPGEVILVQMKAKSKQQLLAIDPKNPFKMTPTEKIPLKSGKTMWMYDFRSKDPVKIAPPAPEDLEKGDNDDDQPF